MAKLNRNKQRDEIAFKRPKTPHQQKQSEKILTPIGLILLVFGLICWLMKGYFADGYDIIETQVPSIGGIHGPFKVEQANSNMQIAVAQWPISVGTWVAVDVEVLDENKQYLFGFGDEFWHETGYDEGHWDESNNSMYMNIHFEKAGDYYLSLTAESNSNLATIADYKVSLARLRGSGVAFQWLMWITLALGTLVLFYRYREHFGESD